MGAQAPNPLPKNLRHGISISYVFGNALHYYARGLNPYESVRLNNLLIEEDFTRIRNAGFDHVRIPWDPYTMGVSPDGTVCSVVINPQCNANFEALQNTITEATNADLAVIVDFHPNVISSAHYQKYKDNLGSPASNGPATYPSAVRKDLVTSADVTTQVWADHPLVKMWKQFILKFADHDAENVYFEILNEPMAEFGTFGFISPSPSDQNLRDWEREWRIVQKEAIKGIQNTIAQNSLPEFKLICSSYLELPEDIEGWKDNQFPNLPLRTVWKNTNNGQAPYGPAEVPHYENLIYSYHIYEPYRFTHYVTHAGLPIPPYFQSRDYYKVTASAPSTPEVPEDDATRGFSRDKSINPMMSNIDDVHTIWISDPYGNVYDVFVPMMVTEFGAKRFPKPGMADPPLGPGGPFPPTESEPTIDWDGRENVANLYRRQWHYDVRKALEQRGYGWTLYEYFGDMGLLNGVVFNNAISTTQKIHGHPGFGVAGASNSRGDIDSTLVSALFNEPRPTQ